MRSVLNTLPDRNGNTAASASGSDLEKNGGLDCAISEHIYYHNGLIVMIVSIE